MLRCGPVPVPFVASCTDHIAGPDRNDVAAARRRESCAFGDVRSLIEGIECPALRVPGVKWAALTRTREGFSP